MEESGSSFGLANKRREWSDPIHASCLVWPSASSRVCGTDDWFASAYLPPSSFWRPATAHCPLPCCTIPSVAAWVL